MENQKVRAIEEPDSIRGMRLDCGDDRIFWFRDDLHNPYPVSTLGMSTVHRGHMWGYALSAEEAQLPPSRGAVIKTHCQRVYLGFVTIDDPKEIESRAKNFGPFLEKNINNWDEFYGEIVREGRDLTVPNVTLDLTELSYQELAEQLRKCEKANMRCWYLHFKGMYVADTVYIQGEQFVKEHGMEEKDYTQLLTGAETKGLATDRGQFLLCSSAVDREEVRALLESAEPTEAVIDKIQLSKQGQEWWQQVQEYLSEFGHRLTAAILDVNFPTWYENPTPVIENIRSMIPKMRSGWDFEKDLQETRAKREKAINRFEQTLKPEDKEVFEENLPKWQNAYQYNEDHWFYLEQVNFCALRYAAMEAGRRLCQLGIMDNPEDVFHVTCDELVEPLEGLEEAETPARYAYSHLLRPLVAYRKKQYEEAEAEKPPAFIGNVPEKIEDPIAIKVFGLTDFVLEKARGETGDTEAKVIEAFEGFPGAPGVVEGPARIIMHHDGFPKLKSDDILVCPYTSPAWTPIFPKIKGVVTDSGGMLTHAAITAREYGIPAVVGTWVATTAIKDGDVIRINGTEGRVEIISRAQGG
jgi:pyruvate,water dikinase